jgi:hypothetical protein
VLHLPRPAPVYVNSNNKSAKVLTSLENRMAIEEKERIRNEKVCEKERRKIERIRKKEEAQRNRISRKGTAIILLHALLI